MDVITFKEKYRIWDNAEFQLKVKTEFNNPIYDFWNHPWAKYAQLYRKYMDKKQLKDYVMIQNHNLYLLTNEEFTKLYEANKGEK
ncbi:hypothetical protein [Mycoplasma sp. 4423]